MYKLKDVTTGVIPDLHIPGQLKDALEFCQDTFNDKKVQQIICIGDLVDHHFISRHPTELDALNPREEWQKARTEVNRWTYAFPEVFLCKGNHDFIHERQAQTLGMPDLFLKSINDIYGLPETWIWSHKFLLFDSVIVDHGLGSGGMYGAKRTANSLACSYVQGHTHAHAAVFNLPRPLKDGAAMNVGCLVDNTKYNMRYGEQIYKIPMSLGCGIIHESNHMEFVPYK